MKYKITVMIECEALRNDNSLGNTDVAGIVAATASKAAVESLDNTRKARVVDAYAEFTKRVKAVLWKMQDTKGNNERWLKKEVTVSKLESLIYEMQEAAEAFEFSGDNKTFQTLDLGAYYLRELSCLLEECIPDVDKGIMQHHSQNLLAEIKELLEI